MNVTKKRAIVLATAVTVALGGGVAYAYWTTTGSGTATATANSDVNLVVNQAAPAVSGLYPGGLPQTITFTVDNPNANAETLSSAVVAVTGTSDPGCTAADFLVTQPTLPATIAGGAQVTVSNGAVQMLNRNVNQNACKGVTVNLSIDVS